MIEEFISRSGRVDRSRLVVELVLLDVNYRARCGETPVLSDYADRFPEESELLRERLPPDHESADQSFESTITQGLEARTVTDAEPVARLGRYELTGLLGTGGFGEVWRAWDPTLKRHVAVKTLRSDREFPHEVVEQFLEEGRKLARLEHPFVVPVYDVGFVADRFYIVSKLVEGETLEDRIKREPRLPAADAAEIVARVAEALHHAHLQGLVHRDIKPSNILLDQTGRPHVADFGLAISEEEQLDEGPSTVGTYAYMSPEQVRGASNLVDARSDVYSLGVVLYRLVTERTPFLGRNRSEWEQQIQSRPPRPPRTIRDDIPASLEDVCLKCLSKDIDGRFRTAADLAQALREATSGEAAAAPVPRRPHARLSMVIGAVALFAASIFAVFKLSGDRDGAASPVAGVRPVELQWPFGDRVSYWNVGPGGRTLIVNCKDQGVIQIGELLPEEPDVDISVEISQINPTGEIGLVWGNRVADDDTDYVQFELWKIGTAFGGDRILMRKHLRRHSSVMWDTIEHEISSVDIDDPGRSGHTMLVRIRNGHVAELEWDGVLQPELLDEAVYPEWAHDDAFGEIGVFVDGTSANFSNIRINGKPIHLLDP